MLFDQSVDIFEALKSSIFFTTVLLVLPIFFLEISSVDGAQSFPVYRVNQLDLAGSSYGSRSTFVNMEARALNSGAVTRKCVVARLQELSLSAYRNLVDNNAGALLILLPSMLDNLTEEQQEQLRHFEKAMLSEETVLPIYFAVEGTELADIYSHVRSSANADKSASATDALLQSVVANGFQMNVHTTTAKPLSKHRTLNFHGLLEGSGNAERLPTLLFVAHYDSTGVAPGLSYGADSNGSGVAALLELMRIFSRLFNSSRPNHNVAFLLSGSGKLNYFGTKKWLEEMRESSKFPYLSEVESVVCLDSVGGDSSKMYVHVSKPPKDESSNGRILKYLKMIGAENGLAVEMVHKKIYLGDSMLAWEHEQFAMNKMAGMTLSALDTHKSSMRSSILDRRSRVSGASLAKRVEVIGEAVARYMFTLPDSSEPQVQILSNDLAVQAPMINAWLDVLTSQPRAPQFMDTSNSIVTSFEQTFNRHLTVAGKTSYGTDKRDVEFVLYDSSVETMHVYSVKPAVFDLALAAVIAAYLGGFYLLSLAYPRIAEVLMNRPSKKKQ